MHDVSHLGEEKKKVKTTVFLIVHPDSTSLDILYFYTIKKNKPKEIE